MENKLLRFILLLVACISQTFGHVVSDTQTAIPLWTLLLTPDNTNPLPRRFRTTQKALPTSFEIQGLADLNMSGSSQFSVSQFHKIVAYLKNKNVWPGQLVVIDLREEPHAFINDYPVTWNAKGAWWTHGDPVALVLESEKKCFGSLSLGQYIVLKKIVKKNEEGKIVDVKEFPCKIKSLQAEEQLVTATGAHYVRLPVTDHVRPEDKDVDQFLNLLKTLPLQAWIHFHCHAGRGRTSTFMIMYDMVRNPKVPREAIIDRQVQLGSLDVRHRSYGVKARKNPQEKERHHFINRFYDYVNAPDGYGVTSWTKWIRRDAPHENNGIFSNSRVPLSGRENSHKNEFLNKFRQRLML